MQPSWSYYFTPSEIPTPRGFHSDSSMWVSITLYLKRGTNMHLPAHGVQEESWMWVNQCQVSREFPECTGTIKETHSMVFPFQFFIAACCFCSTSLPAGYFYQLELAQYHILVYQHTILNYLLIFKVAHVYIRFLAILAHIYALYALVLFIYALYLLQLY